MKKPTTVNPSQMTRKEHVEWCKQRALHYVEIGMLQEAVASMLSDMSQHPQNEVNSFLGLLGLMEAEKGNAPAVKRWIEGFN